MNKVIKRLYDQFGENFDIKGITDETVIEDLKQLTKLEIERFSAEFGWGNIFRHAIIAALCERQAEMIHSGQMGYYPWLDEFIEQIKHNIEIFSAREGGNRRE